MGAGQRELRLRGLLGRLGISREGHGSLAASQAKRPTGATGCTAATAGAVTETLEKRVGGWWWRRDYLAAKMHCWEAQMDQWAAGCRCAKCVSLDKHGTR